MKEKKLTDEEIVKALEHCATENTCRGCVKYNGETTIDYFKCMRDTRKNVVDLFHRLQAENERLKDEKKEIKMFNIAIQNGEVDMRIESEMAKSFYNSIIQVFEQNGAKNFFTTTVDIDGQNGRYAFTIEKVGGQTVAEKLAEQKTEIERLTEENEHLDGCAKQFLADYQKCEIANTELQELNAKYYNEAKDLRRENAELQKQVDELTDKLGKVLSGIKADELLVAKGIEQAVKDAAKEILDEVSKHFGGRWLVELYKKYGLNWSVEVE